MTMKNMLNFIKIMKLPYSFAGMRLLASIFFLANLFLATQVFADQLTASVDRDTIGIQETFTLTVSADSRVSSKPDFSSLQNDFEINFHSAT